MATKHEFEPGLLASLRPSGGERGRLLEVALDQISPDPDQPRKTFEETGLKALAETIRIYGILQPLALRKSQDTGKWVLVHGERRWRAAALAGLQTVPAFEAKREGEGELGAAQVIENRHREDLTNSEIASAIATLTNDRRKDEQIALIVGLPKQQLKHYRALLRLPSPLQPWANRLDARVVYELFLAWDKADEQWRGVIVDRLNHLGSGNLSIADARRLIATLGIANEKVMVPGETVKPLRGGSQQENERLRETIARLVMLLRNAAEIIRPSNLHEADRLMREADNAQAHVSLPVAVEGQGAFPD